MKLFMLMQLEKVIEVNNLLAFIWKNAVFICSLIRTLVCIVHCAKNKIEIINIQNIIPGIPMTAESRYFIVLSSRYLK